MDVSWSVTVGTYNSRTWEDSEIKYMKEINVFEADVWGMIVSRTGHRIDS